MDFLKKAVSDAVTGAQQTQNNNNNTENSNSHSNSNQKNSDNSQNTESGLLGKISQGASQAAEKQEDMLDKAIDIAQEYVFKTGSQKNESLEEQAKDSFIANTIRSGYKSTTGKDFPTL